VLRTTLTASYPDAIFVYGMMWISGSVAPRSVPFLLNLNAVRNHFEQDCPCPMVLWMPEFLLTMLAEAAPDFLCVHRSLYLFSSSETERRAVTDSLQSLGLTAALGLALDERRERLEEITSLLKRVRCRPENQRNLSEEAYLLDRLATLYQEQGRYAEAEPLYQQALTILVESLGPQHPNTKTVSGNYLSCLVEMGREEEVEERAPGFVAWYKAWKAENV
jgi:tetratricopeptide (TPR) repeat protein